MATPRISARASGSRPVVDMSRNSTNGVAKAVPIVLVALEDVGIAVASISVARPSLDDVYLRYAGRRVEGAA